MVTLATASISSRSVKNSPDLTVGQGELGAHLALAVAVDGPHPHRTGVMAFDDPGEMVLMPERDGDLQLTHC